MTTRKGILKKFLKKRKKIYTDHTKKNILVLGEDPTQGLEDTTKTAEAVSFSIIFAESGKGFVVSIQWKTTVFYFSMPQK